MLYKHLDGDEVRLTQMVDETGNVGIATGIDAESVRVLQCKLTRD